ncbi:MAG: PilX N-terminal domain-containing pilus assembly protein [Pseudomonadota bacterium]
MNHPIHTMPSLRRQRGAALFISVMFLIILTLIGVSAANVSVMQERMAGNVRETNDAFLRAERTLRAIEDNLTTAVTGSGGFTSIPIWPDILTSLSLSVNDCTMSQAAVDTWPWQTFTETIGGETITTQFVVISLTDFELGGVVYGSPCRPMNEANPTPTAQYFLVAARAQGNAGVGDVVVQSIFYWPS